MVIRSIIIERCLKITCLLTRFLIHTKLDTILQLNNNVVQATVKLKVTALFYFVLKHTATAADLF